MHGNLNVELNCFLLVKKISNMMPTNEGLYSGHGLKKHTL